MIKSTDTVVAKVIGAHNALSLAGGQVGKTVVFSDMGEVLFVVSPELVSDWVKTGGPYAVQFRLVVGGVLKRRQVVEAINAWAKL